MFDEALLDDADLLQRRDEARLLWHLATAGSQVRRAVEVEADFDPQRLSGETPRAVLVATDAPSTSAARTLIRLCADAAPAIAWHGVELPRWAGPADALLVGAVDGRHPRLAELTAQAARRGLALAVVAPVGSPVVQAAGRAPVHVLPADLHPAASRWSVLTPLVQAARALGLVSAPGPLLARVADALDETAEACRASGDSFTNPAKALAAEFADTRPVVVGAGAFAGLAARVTTDALQAEAGAAAVAISLPDGAGRAGALLRGPGPAPVGDAVADDFFRDRVEDAGAVRARLLVIGDDGGADDLSLGQRSGAHVQLDEVAARRAAAALRRLADDLGLRASSVDVPDGPPLARFAAAAAFGEFTAAYLALGLGLDPSAPAPAELAH